MTARGSGCIRIPGLHPYGAVFSPYDGSNVAIASAQNFGIAGKGTVSVHDRAQGWNATFTGDWTDGIFSVCWSEVDPFQVITASGDGSCQLWSLSTPGRATHVFKEHTKEVNRVAFCQAREGPLFASASWDSTVKIWDCQNDRIHSINTLSHHGYVYDVRWNTHRAHTLASSCEDGTVTIWDIRISSPAKIIRAHLHESLCCDWNKYDPNLLISGSVDRSIRGFDIRAGAMSAPLFVIEAHQLAVRTVAWSPFDPNVIASGSYDMHAFLWTFVNEQTPNKYKKPTKTRSHTTSRSQYEHHHQQQQNPHAGATSLTGHLENPSTFNKTNTEIPFSVPDDDHGSRTHNISSQKAPLRIGTQPQQRLLGRHSEFVTGVDFNVLDNEIVHCSWDSTVCIDSFYSIA